ncbi:MAG: hypothetical protein QOJ62_1685, partial [Actinomycetota bacterium]|nr:hypothetical protein [Actinomycetota bacterium]
RITAIETDVEPTPDAVRLAGLVLPGLANVHSHAFHRALRGRTQRATGDFWSWREQMYAVADCLDPETYLALARAAYAEMVLAGITCVGEFHYLHHGRGGTPYADPNAMTAALVQAASDAGVRITLLDTCYLAGGFGEPLAGPQLRFGDGDAQRWAQRVEAAVIPPHARLGAAIHSVRAVPIEQLPVVAAWAHRRQAPLHAHVSEQPAENEASVAAHGRTPTQLLADAGALGSSTVAVHATHVTPADIDSIATSGAGVCLCPTTERDLADGIGPAAALAARGVPLSLGSDSHAVVDLFEEARAVELDERLATRRRGHFRAETLLDAATIAGHRALGWPDAGAIATGMRADFVAVDLGSVRTGGCAASAEAVVFAASAADVTDVVVDGKAVVRERRHVRFDDVGRALADAIAAVTR